MTSCCKMFLEYEKAELTERCIVVRTRNERKRIGKEGVMMLETMLTSLF